MLKRENVEKEYTALFDDYNYGTTTWSPLHYGILTGKYNNGLPEGTRLAKKADYFKDTIEEYFGETSKEKTVTMLNTLSDIAKELGGSLPQLALAWILKCDDVTTVILGASRPAQIEENLKALVMKEKITDEVSKRIEDALGNRPK